MAAPDFDDRELTRLVYARGYVPAVFAQSPGLCDLFGFRLSFRERFGAAVL
jgi:hypothetical protein